METTEILDYQNQSNQITYAIASKSKRFINFIIDRILFYIVIFLVGAAIGATLMASGNVSFLDTDLETPFYRFLDLIISLVVYAIFYAIQESLLKGKTLGKFITKTRAVNEDNSKMNVETVLKRSFFRIIPFEPLSFLGSSSSGWHDRWSQTKVIEDINWRG